MASIPASAPLPVWLVEQLTRPPATGRHQWMFIMALKLLRYRTPADTLLLLSAASSRVTRSVPERELSSAVENAARIHSQNGAKPLSPAQRLAVQQRKWPPPLLREIDQIVRHGPRHEEGRTQSPVKFDPASRHSEEVIDTIYPLNPLLCVARRGSWDFCTAPREELRGLLHLCSLLVPSPMSAPAGLTQAKRPSAHSLSNVGPRYFLVVEFDFVRVDEEGNPTTWTPLLDSWEAEGISIRDACMSLLLHLATSAPLILIVHSAGKSDHGWFYVHGWAEAQLRAWMQYAVKLGACPSTWSPAQFCRMPDGTRYPGRRRQEILYFNPELLP